MKQKPKEPSPFSEAVKKSDKARTLSAAVTDQLRESIVSCQFLPGTRLRLDALRETYQVGYSPLREALMKLANDGLVQLEDQKGFRVSPVSESDLRDVMNTRILLDRVTLIDAANRGDEHWEGEIVAAFHKLSRQALTDEFGAVNHAWFIRHGEFHYALISAAENELLKKYWLQSYERAERYRRLALTYASATRNDIHEHEQLMKAALDRDISQLANLSASHIQKTHDIIKYDIGKRIDIF